jgi:hypothetical protein
MRTDGLQKSDSIHKFNYMMKENHMDDSYDVEDVGTLEREIEDVFRVATAKTGGE